MTAAAEITPGLDESRVWKLLLALARQAKAGRAVLAPCGLRLDPTEKLEVVGPDFGWIRVHPEDEPCYSATVPLDRAAAQLLDLYMPLCVGPKSTTLVVGHIGQSLDGQIATATGDSRYVTGSENLHHVHRLRALFSAVVVGAGTVDRDDPQLTTRLVRGDNPTRVVITPTCRLSPQRRLFQDALAPTLIVCARDHGMNGHRPAHVEVVEIDAQGEHLPPGAIVAALRLRGLGRIFLEGGGFTVSRFVEAGALDRLHIAIAPVLLGSGRPGLKLPPIDRIDDAIRPQTRRFDLGSDVLFDCCLGGSDLSA
jgi:riboflavin-specific deaminase-like protein